MQWSNGRAIPRIAAASACALAAFASSATWVVAESAWAPRVSAEYKVKVAGVDFGTFNFVSKIESNSYAFSGYSKLTWGLGLLSWIGKASSTGTLGHHQGTDRVIHPIGYQYEFKTKKRSGGARIGFDATGVTAVKVDPPPEDAENIVPLRQDQLKGVLDPMSALMALSHGSSANPCGRRVGVFDGKRRFDVELSFRRQERVAEKKPSGQPPLAYVCRVRYIPVSGHKHNRVLTEMARNDRIEVAMRPIPAANMLVPYRITIPTSIGTTYIYARKVEIVTPGQHTIALAH